MDEQGGADLQDLHEARRRIAGALAGVAAGAEALARRLAEAPNPAEIDGLRAAVEEERVVNAQLAERVRVLHGREAGRVAELERSLAAARGEVAGLEARRVAERAELDAVLAELLPLIEDAR